MFFFGTTQTLIDLLNILLIQSHLNSCFERQLNCSVSSTDTGIPLFVPKPGRELLHQQAQLTTQKNTGKYLSYDNVTLYNEIGVIKRLAA